jgi:transposase
MSKGQRYTEAFKIEAVKPVTDRGYSVQEVAEQLGMTTKSLYNWRSPLTGHQTLRPSSEDSVRIAQLEAQLKWVTEERDRLKKTARYFVSSPE